MILRSVRKMFGGLDVAMDDAFAVRRVERVGNLDADVDDLVRPSAARRRGDREALALHELHHDERLALVLADVVDGADVRGDSAPRPRASARRRSTACLRRSPAPRAELEGDVASEPIVLRPVDDAHAARPELADDSVVRDGPSDHKNIRPGLAVRLLTADLTFYRIPARG